MANPATLVTFVDTSGWYASLVPDDKDHLRATLWLRSYRGRLLTTDYVIDETLTLLRSRGQADLALDWGASIFGPNPAARIRYLDRVEIAPAWAVFERYADKDWSFTDCTSKVVIEALAVPQAFSFDRHFRQFGTVAVVP